MTDWHVKVGRVMDGHSDKTIPRCTTYLHARFTAL